MDLIEKRLNDFLQAVHELPARYKSFKTEEETVNSIDDLFEFSLDDAEKLLYEFMGYTAKIDRIKAKEFTHSQIEMILMIDVSFQVYFENNLIVARTNRGANSNAKTAQQKMDQLIEATSHAFGASSDPHYAENIKSKYQNLRQNSPDFQAYNAIYNRLNGIYDTEIDPLPDDIIMMLQTLRTDAKSKGDTSKSYPGVSVSLPTLPKPKKP